MGLRSRWPRRCFSSCRTGHRGPPALRGMRLGVRTLLVRQRTRTINHARHLAEFGIVAPKGTAHPGRSKT